MQLRSPRCCHWWPRAQGERAKTAQSRAPISRRGRAGPGRTMALGRGRREEELLSWRCACLGSVHVPRRVGRPLFRAHGVVGEKRRFSGRAPLPWISTPYPAQWTGRRGAGPGGVAGDAKRQVVRRQFRTASCVCVSVCPSIRLSILRAPRYVLPPEEPARHGQEQVGQAKGSGRCRRSRLSRDPLSEGPPCCAAGAAGL